MRRVIVPLMLLSVACQPATTDLTDADNAAIAEEVNAVNADFWDAWRAADFDRGISHYYDSPDLAFAMQGIVDFGYGEIDAKYRPGMANVADQAITVTNSQTTVLADDVVCVMDGGTYTATDTSGITRPEMGFAVTNIWVRRDGEWKIHVGHESFALPEAESM